MSRPNITFEALVKNSKSLYTAFAGIASSSDYEKIYRTLAFTNIYSLKDAISVLAQSNPTITKKVEDFANAPENYNAVMQNLLSNIYNFNNVIIPIRSSDFIVSENNSQDTYFWIEERIEISEDLKNKTFHVAKLMVDEKSDSLLFNNGEDGWMEYKEENEKDDYRKFSGEVARKYKEYLAEKQLLKD